MAREPLKFEIVKTLGVISTNTKGWSKELNLVSWNDRRPVYDLRSWDGTHEHMGKGITLNDEEVQLLTDILKKLEP